MTEASADRSTTTVQNPPQQAFTVFLVDDDLDDLFLSEHILKNSQYIDNIVCLTSGRELFNELRSRNFFSEGSNAPSNCLIMMDIHMPNEDGISLLTQLRANPFTEKIPVVMLTEDCGTGNIEKTYKMQASGYLTKPLRIDHLNHIQNILERAYEGKETQH